jgi:homoserine O-acetyltransferase
VRRNIRVRGDTAALVRTIKAPTLLLVPRLDLYNPVDDAIEAAKLVPSVTLVRLDGQAGHAVATDTSPELDDIRGAIGKFLTSHAGPR